jgi:hypothetical protein
MEYLYWLHGSSARICEVKQTPETFCYLASTPHQSLGKTDDSLAYHRYPPEIPAYSKGIALFEPDLVYLLEESRWGHLGLRLTVVYDWLFRSWYIFLVMELKTRRIVYSTVTFSD